MTLVLRAARAITSVAIVILFTIGALPIMAAQSLIRLQKLLTDKIEGRA